MLYCTVFTSPLFPIVQSYTGLRSGYSQVYLSFFGFILCGFEVESIFSDREVTTAEPSAATTLIVRVGLHGAVSKFDDNQEKWTSMWSNWNTISLPMAL